MADSSRHSTAMPSGSSSRLGPGQRVRGVGDELLVVLPGAGRSVAALAAEAEAMMSGAPVKRAAATPKFTGALSEVSGHTRR